MQTIKLLGIASLALGGAACTTSSSQDVTTHGMSAEIDARTDGTGTTEVTATLFFGDPLGLDFVRITGDDKLTASDPGGETKTMSETDILNIVSHEASFDTGDEGDEFTVALTRSVDGGAPSSTATLPGPFTLDPGPTTASRAQELTLTWDTAGSAGDPMDWASSGTCIQAGGGTIPNNGADGTLTIPAGTILLDANSTTTSCDVTIVVERRRDGDLDPHYGKGGDISGTQFRSVKFSSTP